MRPVVLVVPTNATTFNYGIITIIQLLNWIHARWTQQGLNKTKKRNLIYSCYQLSFFQLISWAQPANDADVAAIAYHNLNVLVDTGTYGEGKRRVSITSPPPCEYPQWYFHAYTCEENMNGILSHDNRLLCQTTQASNFQPFKLTAHCQSTRIVKANFKCFNYTKLLQ